MSTPIRICLLGPLSVVRRDGSLVDAAEWRTAKTTDLLRLLACDAGRPVRTALLLQRLWPEATPQHAKGSLRTAASHVRKALREDCVHREPGALVLVGAWVDVQVLEWAAKEATAAVRLGQRERVVSMAQRCEQLYRDDFHAHDDDSDWARAEREHLITLRCQLLTDAAQCALQLGMLREALEFAHVVERVEGSVERVHRILMRAYADLGEVGRALSIFERYRRQLADDLGVDPAPSTQDLHLRLLRGQ